MAGYADCSRSQHRSFRHRSALTIVDLRDVPTCPRSSIPPFGACLPTSSSSTASCETCRRSLTRATSNLDHIPTQAMAETMRYDHSAYGVLWRSSKDPSVTSCAFIPRRDS